METAGSAEGPAVRDALDAVEGYMGVTGTTITFKDQNRIALRDVTLVEVMDGTASSIGQFEPNPDLVIAP